MLKALYHLQTVTYNVTGVNVFYLFAHNETVEKPQKDNFAEVTLKSEPFRKMLYSQVNSPAGII